MWAARLSSRSLAWLANSSIVSTTTMSSGHGSRKPGAFAAYRYRDDLFPTTPFRLAYDRLVRSGVEKADRDYVRILHLAASTEVREVETALSLLLETSALPAFDAVRDLVHLPHC